ICFPEGSNDHSKPCNKRSYSSRGTGASNRFSIGKDVVDEDTVHSTEWLDSLFRTGSCGFVLLLQLPQLVPALVLFGLGGITIFFALKPEAKPVHRTSL